MNSSSSRQTIPFEWLWRNTRLGNLWDRLWPRRVTARQKHALLRLILCAQEHNIPLPELLAAHAEDEVGVQRRHLRRLMQLLKQGAPLADAVERVPQCLDHDARVAIRLGSQSGVLLPMLRETLSASVPPDETTRVQLKNALAYVFIVGSVFLLLFTFQVVKIGPSTQWIARDFGVQPPAIFDWLHRVGVIFVNSLPLLFLIGVLGVWLAFTGRLGRTLTSGWLAPFVGRSRRLRSASILRWLGVVKEHGKSLPGAISTLARYHYDPVFRPALLFVRNELEQGAELWQSMRDVKLLTASEAKLLATAEQVGNTAWGLKLVARRKLTTLNRRQRLLAEFARPAIILGFALIILMASLGWWLLLTSFVNSLA